LVNVTQDVRRKHLIVAALLAGAAGVALIVLGWWLIDWQYQGDRGRLTDPSWWTSATLRMLGYLAIGKAGFKVALVTVVGAVAAVGWLRARRRRGVEQPVGKPADGEKADDVAS
jgi:hypothetical protein